MEYRAQMKLKTFLQQMLLSGYYVTGLVLGNGDSSVSKRDEDPWPSRAELPVWEEHNLHSDT